METKGKKQLTNSLREKEIKYSKREERRGFTCQHGRLHNRMKNGDG